MATLWLRWGSLFLAAAVLWQLLTMTPGTRWIWRRVLRRARTGNLGVGTWNGVPDRFFLSDQVVPINGTLPPPGGDGP